MYGSDEAEDDMDEKVLVAVVVAVGIAVEVVSERRSGGGNVPRSINHMSLLRLVGVPDSTTTCLVFCAGEFLFAFQGRFFSGVRPSILDYPWNKVNPSTNIRWS